MTSEKNRIDRKHGQRRNFYSGDIGYRLSRIEGEILHLRNIEQQKRKDEEIKKVISKQKAKANIEFWWGYFIGFGFGVAITCFYVSKRLSSSGLFR